MFEDFLLITLFDTAPCIRYAEADGFVLLVEIGTEGDGTLLGELQCGVKESDEEKIFEHFYKSDIYKEGIGLGLSLARRVARQLGGDVLLDSDYKDGSRFILKLPKE